MRMNKKLKNVLAFGLATSFVLTSTMGALATDDGSTTDVAVEAYAAESTVSVPLQINWCTDWDNVVDTTNTTISLPGDQEYVDVDITQYVPAGYVLADPENSASMSVSTTYGVTGAAILVVKTNTESTVSVPLQINWCTDWDNVVDTTNTTISLPGDREYVDVDITQYIPAGYVLADPENSASMSVSTTYGVTGAAILVVKTEPEKETRTVNVTFNVDPEKGEFTDPAGAKVVTFNDLDEYSDEQYKIPTVKGINGYKFVGWKGQGAEEINWSADAKTFGVAGLAAFTEGSNVGYASVEAVFEKEEEPAPEKRTVNVTFNVDSEKGEFTDPAGAEVVTFNNLDEYSDEQYNIPSVKGINGYKFVGWKGQGAEEINWSADAKTFGVTGLAFFEEGAKVGYASIEAVFEKEEEPAPETRTVNVTFNVDPEKGEFTDPAGAEVVTFNNLDEYSDEQYNIPSVKGINGYKFVGWKGQGAEEINWSADAKTFGVTGLAFFEEGAKVGYASIEAVFEKEEEPAPETRTANVYFNVDPEKGSFPAYAPSTVVSFENLDEFSDQQFEIPAVEAKEGYKFVGWKGQGADVIEWSADAKTFGVTGLAFFEEGSNVGYASIEAVFEKEETPEPETRTVTVNFTVDPEKGSFPDYAPSTLVKFENVDEFSDQQFEIPAVEAKEGYKFVGWKGQGADVIEWDADATTFGVTGLAFFAEGSNVGYASVDAVFEKVEEPAPETRTVNVYFAVDPEKGSFPAYAPSTVVSFENLDEFSDQQLEIPAVEAKEGYKFVGWKGQGADVIEWDADAKTFGVTGLAFFEEGSNVGNASVEAVFEEVEPETTTETEPTTTEPTTEPTTTEPTTEPTTTEPTTEPTTTVEPTTTEPATEEPTTVEPITDSEEETTEEETETDKKTVVTEKNNKSDDNSNKTSDSAVKTGDTTTVMPYVIALFAAAALIVVLALKKRRTF